MCEQRCRPGLCCGHDSRLFLPSSRQTQWDPPTWESPGDEASLEHEAEMDLGTPTYDENPMKVGVAGACVSWSLGSLCLAVLYSQYGSILLICSGGLLV